MNRTLFSPGRFDAFNHFISVFPKPVHLYQSLGRMLQVAVNNRNTVSPAFGKTCKDCCFFSEISGKLQPFNAVILLGKFHYPGKGSVLRTVGYKQKVIFDIRLFQYFSYCLCGALDIFFFIVGWNHYS